MGQKNFLDQAFADQLNQLRREVQSMVGSDGGYDIMQLIDGLQSDYKAIVKERDLLRRKLAKIRAKIEQLGNLSNWSI